MLEHAWPRCRFLERAERADAAVVDEDQLARLDVAQEGRADHVERDAFRREDGRLAKLAHYQGTDSEGIAAGDQPLIGEHEQRIGPLDLFQRIGQPVEPARIVGSRDEVDDDFRVARRLEDRAAAVERPPKLERVRQIAVVRDSKAAAGKFGEQWLDIPQRRLAGGRVAHVADPAASGELAHDILAIEVSGDVAHRPVRVKMLAVEGGDPGRFLAAVLERVKAKRNQAGGAVGTPDAEDPHSSRSLSSSNGLVVSMSPGSSWRLEIII